MQLRENQNKILCIMKDACTKNTMHISDMIMSQNILEKKYKQFNWVKSI